MSTNLTKQVIALVCGLIFGIGLSVSQMVNPDKVLNFLDIFGQFDPSLLLVMAAALVIFTGVFFTLVRTRNKPICDDSFDQPKSTTIDKSLLQGAAIFGIGWGLSGICPGPALANISGMQGKILVFIVMMLVGMWLADKYKGANHSSAR